MKMLNYLFLFLFLFSFSSEVLSETRKMEYRCKKVPGTGAGEFSRFIDIKITPNGFDGEVKFFSKRRNKFFIQTFAGETAVSGNFEINSRILSEDRKPKSKQGFIKFDKSNQQNINLIPYLDKGVRATHGPRLCTLKLLPNKQKLIQKVNKRKELTAQKIEKERNQKELAAQKAEEERIEKELAAQKAEEQRIEKELAKQKIEEERKQKDDEAIKLIETKRKEMEIRLAAIKAKRDKQIQENALLLAEEERKSKEAKLAADKVEQTRKDEERRLAEAILKVEEAERKAEEDDQKRKEDKARRLKEAADIEKKQQEAKLENERKVKAEQNKKLFSKLETKGKSYIKDAQIFIQDNLTSPNMLPISMAALELKKALNSNNGIILKKAIKTFKKKMREFSDFDEYRRLLIEKRKQKQQVLAKQKAEAEARRLAEEAKIEAEAISKIKAIFTSYKAKLVKLLSISLSVNSSVSEKLIPIIQEIDNGIKSNDKAKLESSLNNIKKLIKSNNEISKYINGEPKKIKKSKNIPEKTNVAIKIKETFFCVSSMNMKELLEITKMWASFNKISEQEDLYKTMAPPDTKCTFNKVDKIKKLENEKKVSTSKDGIVTYVNVGSEKMKNGKIANYVFFYRQVKLSKTSSNILNNNKVKQIKKSIKKFKAGIEYKNYNANFKNVKCTNSKTEVCITNSEYKRMCNKAKGVTRSALRMAAVQFSSDYGRWLHTDGNYQNQRIGFNKDYNNCGIYFEISGMYKGTSKREIFNGRASSFVVNKKRNVLIGYFR